MDMGVSAASGIAQRFADHVCDQFQAMMDDWEDTWWKTCTNEELLKWRQQRIELGKVTKKREDRLVHVLVYTDDPKIDCASNEHCIAALQIWRIVTRSWNVILASIDKCSIGAANKWCGMLHYSCFALAVIPMSKQVKLMSQLKIAASGVLQQGEEYHSLLGKLNYYLPMVASTCLEVQGLLAMLWRQLKMKPQAVHRTAWRFKLSKDQSERLGYIRDKVAECPGVSYTTAIQKVASTSTFPGDVHIYVDASGEDAQVPALGGYCHGLWWVLPLTEMQQRWLHITAREFVAVLIALLLFLPFMPPGSRVFVHSDALSAVATMKRHFSKSEVMQWIYEKLTGNKVVQAVRDRLHATHVFGAGNPMADGASRGHLKLMLALSKQLQVKLRQVVVTPEAFRLVEELTNKASSAAGYRGSMGAHKPEELEKLPEVRGNAMADVFKVFAPLPEVTREKKLVFANPSGDCMLCAVTDVLGQLAFGGESSAAQAAWCRQQAERELVSMLDASTADAYAQEEPPRDD
jgi:hypothetical protein